MCRALRQPRALFRSSTTSRQQTPHRYRPMCSKLKQEHWVDSLVLLALLMQYSFA